MWVTIDCLKVVSNRELPSAVAVASASCVRLTAKILGAVILTVGTASAGVLSGVATPGQVANYNLTAANTQWAVWGQGTDTSLSPTDKSLGMTGISDLTSINNGNPLRGLGQFGDYGATYFQWTDGTTTPSATDVYAGIQNEAYGGPSGVGEGFSFSAAAGSELRILTVFTTVHEGQGRLTASLSDSSAAPITIDVDSGGGANAAFTFVLNFQANSASQLLNVQFTLLADNGSYAANAAIQGVSLYTTPSSGGAVPEPTSAAIAFVLMGGTALGKWRKARRDDRDKAIAS